MQLLQVRWVLKRHQLGQTLSKLLREIHSSQKHESEWPMCGHLPHVEKIVDVSSHPGNIFLQDPQIFLRVALQAPSLQHLLPRLDRQHPANLRKIFVVKNLPTSLTIHMRLRLVVELPQGELHLMLHLVFETHNSFCL